jgi:ABC-type sulfate transport system substrate-binding protein
LQAAERELVTLHEAAEILGNYSAMTLYRAAADNELSTFRLGRFQYVLADELHRWYRRKRKHDYKRDIKGEVITWKQSQSGQSNQSTGETSQSQSTFL